MHHLTRSHRARLGLTIFAWLLIVSDSRANDGQTRPVWSDATAVWHLDSEQDVAQRHPLTVQGAVALAVALEGAEREASLARGGDGRAARFDGGYLALASDAGFAINPGQWTIAIRVRDPQGVWRYPLLGSYGGDQSVSVALRAVAIASKPMLDRNYLGHPVPTVESWFAPGGPRAVPGSTLIEAVWGAKEPNAARVKHIRDLQPATARPNPLEQDVLNGVQRVNFPVGLIGPTDWHDVVVALTGPKLELWIDGVLVDEEYPLGETRPRSLPFLIGAGQEHGELQTGFRGLVDHVAVWNRALSPAEIAAVCGGAAHVRLRELAILGDESPTMQYFRARGHNRKVGDCIPYWDEPAGTFRLFYLILRRNMHSKWDGGHGGLEIWQASTKDLKRWTHHPVTIPITEPWEAWNGTGAVAFHNGTYNWFYPTPDYDGRFGGVQRAVSQDGVTFTKVAPHPYLPGGDVEIFQDESGLFHLIKVGPEQRAKTRTLGNKTLVAWVRLADLDHRGGSVLTVEHPDGSRFDGIVFGENAARRWMPGSDSHSRTPGPQTGWAEETAPPDAVVQMALVFDGQRGTLYRNGSEYASYAIHRPLEFPSGSSLLIGLRHTTAAFHNAHFHGRILDARVYDVALTAGQLAELKPDVDGGPKPVAWYDFSGGSLRDRTGSFPDGLLVGQARVENGELVVGEGGYFKVPGILYTQVRLTSPDLETWTQQPGAYLAADKFLGICPHVFPFGDWHYYLCGNGVWKSRGWLGPWTEHAPLRLDNLAVPKTGRFGRDRRIYAGFLPDDGWGGNEVLRELVQDVDGNLGTRFVPELIPACGEPLSLDVAPPEAKRGDSVRVAASDTRQAVTLSKLPADYRLQLEVAPEPGATSFGIALRAGGAQDNACDLVFRPADQRVSFSKMSGSSGQVHGGPSLDAVRSMAQPFAVDIIVRHDLLDVEIAGCRTLTTRFWNPAGDGLRLFADSGAVSFRQIRVRPLLAPSTTIGTEP